MLRIARTIFLLIIAILLAVAFGGCKAKSIAATEVRYRTDSIAIVERDTARVALHERDAVIIRDSVVVVQKGDTLTKEVWRYRDRERIIRDTISDGRTRAYTQVVRDSVRVPYAVEVVKEVRRPLSWWQKTLQSLGWLAIAAAALLITWLVYRKK